MIILTKAEQRKLKKVKETLEKNFDGRVLWVMKKTDLSEHNPKKVCAYLTFAFKPNNELYEHIWAVNTPPFRAKDEFVYVPPYKELTPKELNLERN